VTSESGSSETVSSVRTPVMPRPVWGGGWRRTPARRRSDAEHHVVAAGQVAVAVDHLPVVEDDLPGLPDVPDDRSGCSLISKRRCSTGSSRRRCGRGRVVNPVLTYRARLRSRVLGRGACSGQSRSMLEQLVHQRRRLLAHLVLPPWP
jgi:hypothetical protein